MKRLQDRVAIVTGGGAGIGQACCEVLAEEGAKIVVTDINDQTGQAVADAINASGRQAIYAHCDVGIEDDIAKMTQTALDAFGTIDILINNAGIELFKSALDTTTPEWERCINVDLRGVWLCSKYALPTMLAKGKGAIVNISSVHAVQTIQNIAAYAAAKGGGVAMTRNMALDYAPAVRINAIMPGFIETSLWGRFVALSDNPQKVIDDTNALQPMKRMGTGRDVALSAMFLASDEAAWITGTTLAVDGGLTARLHN
jgi:NAD(P)-dependent dehydrogenase (short-subunit alcohol dehydrogenase family)